MRRAVVLSGTLALAACKFQPLGAADVDAAGSDIDAPARQAVSLASNDHHRASSNSSELSYRVDIPQLADGFLLISVELGMDCESPADVVVNSVALEGTEVLILKQVIGTPCNNMRTRSAHYGMANPPVANDQEVVITLSDAAKSLHSGVFLFEHVDPANPVFGAASSTGESDASSVTIESEPLDLVINTVGQGTHIDRAGDGENELYRSNNSSNTSLDNTGASTMPGAASVTSTWEFSDDDEWQSISLSLRAR